MNYTPLHVYSHYSLLRGLNSPKTIAKYCKKIGIESCALTDINNVSGCIEFYKACKENGIKPIIGSCVSTTEGSIILLAKNKLGYKELLQIIASLNSKKHYNNSLIIPLDEISKFKLDNIICITGHEGSSLYNCITENFKIKENWQQNVEQYLGALKKLFQNLYIEFQFSEQDTFSQEVRIALIAISIKYNLPEVICPRVYYLDKQDKELHKILLSIDTGKSIAELNQINDPLYKFFGEYKFHLPNINEFEESESVRLETSNLIAKEIEDYGIQQLPAMPKFKSGNDKTSEENFREEVAKGWNLKIKGNIPINEQQKYKTRIEEEIAVFKETNLFDYFLIIKDIIDYAKSKNYLVGAGRGSVGGCLTSYLLGIHQLDSIKYNLLFERFYNKGRTTSLPDIDTDFEKRSRSDIINYIVQKYGKKNVMHIATYGTLMGRAALKAVFRAYKDISFAEQNEITKNIVDKAKISDELQLMKDAGEDTSVIKWCLKNRPNNFTNWCSLNEDGQLDGPLATRFEQAIKLEGVISTLSKHAAGICIGPESLKNLVSIIFDPKEKQQIIGCQFQDLEYAGLLKMDLLAISTLDRLKDINEV